MRVYLIFSIKNYIYKFYLKLYLIRFRILLILLNLMIKQNRKLKNKLLITYIINICNIGSNNLF